MFGQDRHGPAAFEYRLVQVGPDGRRHTWWAGDRDRALKRLDKLRAHLAKELTPFQAGSHCFLERRPIEAWVEYDERPGQARRDE